MLPPAIIEGPDESSLISLRSFRPRSQYPLLFRKRKRQFARINLGDVAALQDEPEKWGPVFRKYHYQSTTWSQMVIQPNPVAP
jgi:hypothetical protein